MITVAIHPRGNGVNEMFWKKLQYTILIIILLINWWLILDFRLIGASLSEPYTSVDV